jgi:phosphohistidine phosphatase
MDLILWRHAEAVDGYPDEERRLSHKGIQQANSMAAFLSPRLPSQTRILVSPAIRAQQTASALTKKFTTEAALDTHTSPQAVVSACGWPASNENTLLVGHQPWLGQVAALLMTGTPDYWSVKKGSIWWFSHREREDEQSTILRLVISPEQL